MERLRLIYRFRIRALVGFPTRAKVGTHGVYECPSVDSSEDHHVIDEISTVFFYEEHLGNEFA